MATSSAPASSVAVRSAPGLTGHGGTLGTVGLGDSVPQGSACRQCVTFIERVGTDMAHRASVRASVGNESVSGYKTTDVLTQLESPGTRTLLKTADLAIVTIGANDFDVDKIVARCAHADASCVEGDVDAVIRRVRTILERIKAAMTTPDATVVVTGYWNVGMDGKVGREPRTVTIRHRRATPCWPRPWRLSCPDGGVPVSSWCASGRTCGRGCRSVPGSSMPRWCWRVLPPRSPRPSTRRGRDSFPSAVVGCQCETIHISTRSLGAGSSYSYYPE